MRQLSSRLGRVTPSATLAMKAEADRLRREGRDVIDFGPGEPDFDTPALASRAGVRAIESGFTHYTSPAGVDELRQAIASRYSAQSGVAIDASEVLVGAGGKPILFAAALALIEPGDDVAIFSPYWVSFPDQVKLAGGNPVFVPTRGDDGFTLRAAALRTALTPATRVVIVNAPCNPTGGLLPPAEAEAIAQLAVERDLWVISDETYELFVYGDASQASFLSYRAILGERLIFVSSFSKTFAMTGWRVGYSIAAPAVTKAMLTVQSHDTTQAPSMSQQAALAALREASEAPAAMLAAYEQRRRLVVDALQRMPGVALVPPRGAFYAFPDVRELCARAGIPSSSELCRRLLAEESVATIPGEAFGAPGFLRISYATSEQNLHEGLNRMSGFAARLLATVTS